MIPRLVLACFGRIKPNPATLFSIPATAFLVVFFAGAFLFTPALASVGIFTERWKIEFHTVQGTWGGVEIKVPTGISPIEKNPNARLVPDRFIPSAAVQYTAGDHKSYPSILGKILWGIGNRLHQKRERPWFLTGKNLLHNILRSRVSAVSIPIPDQPIAFIARSTVAALSEILPIPVRSPERWFREQVCGNNGSGWKVPGVFQAELGENSGVDSTAFLGDCEVADGSGRPINPRPLFVAHFIQRTLHNASLLVGINAPGDYRDETDGSSGPDGFNAGPLKCALLFIFGASLIAGAQKLLNYCFQYTDYRFQVGVFGGFLPFAVGVYLIYCSIFPQYLP
jgi:hypothetical protein